MKLDLSQRHALVCGASKGIGRATALELASLGAKVSALARSEAALDALLPELTERSGVQATAVVADMDDRAALSATLSDLVRREGTVHIWVNNTGGPPGGPLTAATADALLAAYTRHIVGAQTILQVLLPGMTEAGWGRIVNVLSTSVREPIPNLGVSNLTRAAVASWAKTLSRELPAGVTINNVLPGFTATDRLASLADSRADREGSSREDVYKAFVSQVPEGRLADPSELAAVIAFLCSDAASYVRGTTLPVDGGRLRSI